VVYRETSTERAVVGIPVAGERGGRGVFGKS